MKTGFSFFFFCVESLVFSFLLKIKFSLEYSFDLEEHPSQNLTCLSGKRRSMFSAAIRVLCRWQKPSSAAGYSELLIKRQKIRVVLLIF